MARMYAPIWNRLAANETVVLTCHISKALTITRMIYMEKSRNKLVKDVGEQPSYGRLRFKRTAVEGKPELVRLTITMSYSGSNL